MVSWYTGKNLPGKSIGVMSLENFIRFAKKQALSVISAYKTLVDMMINVSSKTEIYETIMVLLILAVLDTARARLKTQIILKTWKKYQQPPLSHN